MTGDLMAALQRAQLRRYLVAFWFNFRAATGKTTPFGQVHRIGRIPRDQDALTALGPAIHTRHS